MPRHGSSMTFLFSPHIEFLRILEDTHTQVRNFVERSQFHCWLPANVQIDILYIILVQAHLQHSKPGEQKKEKKKKEKENSP